MKVGEFFMIVDLREVFSTVGKKLDVEAKISLDDYDYNGTIAVAEPVSVVGKIYNRAGVVNFDYNAEFDFCAPCDRCMSEVTTHKSQSYTHIIVTELLNDSSEDEFDFLVEPSMTLDVDSVVRDDLLLDMPTKYLCGDDCKGICAGCGRSLNTDECVCEKEVDPRLAKLKELLND